MIALPIRPHTAWSIELNDTKAMPEWGGQQVRFSTEEDAFFDVRKSPICMAGPRPSPQAHRSGRAFHLQRSTPFS